MRGTAASKSEEGNTTGVSAESGVTWLYPQEGNMETSNETDHTDGLRQVEPEISSPSMTSAWSSFLSSGGLVSSALNKVSSGEHLTKLWKDSRTHPVQSTKARNMIICLFYSSSLTD